MNQCIAIPLENGVLCAHFGHCEEFAIVSIENKQITAIKTVTPPEHEPGLYPRWIASLGVTDVIASGMGQKAINLFNLHNINAFVGAPVLPPKDLVAAYVREELTLRANYCNHDVGHACSY